MKAEDYNYLKQVSFFVCFKYIFYINLSEDELPDILEIVLKVICNVI